MAPSPIDLFTNHPPPSATHSLTHSLIITITIIITIAITIICNQLPLPFAFANASLNCSPRPLYQSVLHRQGIAKPPSPHSLLLHPTSAIDTVFANRGEEGGHTLQFKDLLGQRVYEPGAALSFSVWPGTKGKGKVGWVVAEEIVILGKGRYWRVRAGTRVRGVDSRLYRARFPPSVELVILSSYLTSTTLPTYLPPSQAYLERLINTPFNT